MLHVIFILMPRQPPSATLFPYTTLFRSAEGAGPVNALDNAVRKALLPRYPELADVHLVDYKVRIVDELRIARQERSEEHTSELQSPDHLVCRLLLEKKNTLQDCAEDIVN